MRAMDLMTAPVATVCPDSRVHEIATMLVERRISGLPVVCGRSVVGIVTAGDLIRRHEIGTDRRKLRERWWSRLVNGDSGARDYVRSHALRASDVMSGNVVMVQEDAPVADVVDLLERHRIRRVPVLRGPRLAGIVSRGDIVKAFATMPSPECAARADDESIRRRLGDELALQAWWRDESSLTVSRGIVHYWGVLHSEDERSAARVAAQNVAGVREIRDHRVHISALS